jgi:hypothetical protein
LLLAPCEYRKLVALLSAEKASCGLLAWPYFSSGLGTKRQASGLSFTVHAIAILMQTTKIGIGEFRKNLAGAIGLAICGLAGIGVLGF